MRKSLGFFFQSSSRVNRANAPVTRVTDSYAALVQSGALNEDAAQRKAVEHLEALRSRLDGYRPAQGALAFSGATAFSGTWGRLQAVFGAKGASPPTRSPVAPKGLYMYGDVGAGKTMLMDLFYGTATVPHKKRVHFNAFMLDVHARIHAWKQTRAASDRRYDPIEPVAEAIADDTWLLCFDEFQVTDVVDAVILRRLFSTLFNRGVVVVATSNRAPADLYLNGLQRQLFLPFIDVLTMRCEILNLNSGIDYRTAVDNDAAQEQTYFSPLTAENQAKMDDMFARLSGCARISAPTQSLRILGRDLRVPHVASGVAYFDFCSLFLSDVGAVDYLYLSKQFHTIFVSDIPVLSLAEREAARRFIVFVDNLYDRKVRLVCSAANPLAALMDVAPGKSPSGNGAGAASDAQRMLMDDLNLNTKSATSSIFTGEDEKFAFRRTLSRLTEMRSHQYWNTLPFPVKS